MDRDTVRRFAAKIRDQAVRLSTLVTDLLTLARVEAPTVPGSTRELVRADLTSLVRDVRGPYGSALSGQVRSSSPWASPRNR